MEIIVVVFVLVIIAGIGILLRFVAKKLGYPRVGRVLQVIWGILILALFLYFVFEDQLFTKVQAKKLVEEQQIYLPDKFELDDNYSTWAIGDYYHTFTLTISENDKNNAIQLIKNSDNFKTQGEPVEDLSFSNADRYLGPKRVQNYETKEGFVRELFETNGPGYAPTFRRIIILKHNFQLKFEDIDE